MSVLKGQGKVFWSGTHGAERLVLSDDRPSMAPNTLAVVRVERPLVTVMHLFRPRDHQAHVEMQFWESDSMYHPAGNARPREVLEGGGRGSGT